MQGDTALEIESGGKKTTVAIVDGANFRKWPTDILPVQYGADYRLSGGGLTQPVTVRFTAMESAPDTVEGSVDMLMAKRSEERRVGKECVSKGRSRWWAYH